MSAQFTGTGCGGGAHLSGPITAQSEPGIDGGWTGAEGLSRKNGVLFSTAPLRSGPTGGHLCGPEMLVL